MGLMERESGRKSVVGNMISTPAPSEGCQGKNGQPAEGNKRKQKGFRLSIKVIKALELRALKTGKDQEKIVEEILTNALVKEMQDLKML